MNPLGGPKVGWKALTTFFCFALEFFFNVCFHSKLFLSHLPRTLVVSLLKLVHTTMLEKTLSNKIDNIMLFVGMPSLI
jgi:hypothetical protein